jgi:biopolymer transport protein ExbD
MAKRELEEINAGSMADIAFLLLIFFLVTTTMEVDAGIGRLLPLKLPPTNEPPPEFHERDILEINANSDDNLFVEGEWLLGDEEAQLEQLEKITRDFYTANIKGDVNPNMPTYSKITIPLCQQKIAKLQEQIDADTEGANKMLPGELEKWQTKLKLCQDLPTGQYDEIYKMSMIRLSNQSGTSYGLYIEIQNILKRVVNELRVEQCDKIWGREYFTLDENEFEDQEIIKKLRILVPERIVEAKINK